MSPEYVRTISSTSLIQAVASAYFLDLSFLYLAGKRAGIFFPFFFFSFQVYLCSAKQRCFQVIKSMILMTSCTRNLADGVLFSLGFSCEGCGPHDFALSEAGASGGCAIKAPSSASLPSRVKNISWKNRHRPFPV